MSGRDEKSLGACLVSQDVLKITHETQLPIREITFDEQGDN